MKITIHKYSDHFAKVHALQYSVRLQSEVVKRKRQTLHQVPNTFVSKPCRRILISCLVCILRPVKLRGSKKNIAPVPSFVYNSRKNGKNQYRRRGFWATLYGNILPKFKLKWLKIRCTRTLNVRPSSWKYSLEKTSKTASETFFRLNEIKSTSRENNYLQFTNKRLNLLRNNSAQMLTRQDVK